jgi:hypothetical protein
MKWSFIEIHVGHEIHRASYRLVGDMLEMTTAHGQFRRPKGPLRVEIAAREILRRLIRQSSAAA